MIKFLFFKALIIFSWINEAPLSIGDYDFPKWSQIIGNIISGASIVSAIIYAIYRVIDALYINKKVRITLIKHNF